jgi:hypothetical protein
MKNNKPHQLLATECLDELFKYERTHLIAVAILSWLIEAINRDYQQALRGAELIIVNGRFVGSGYPALGIHYGDVKNPEDLGPMVEAAVEKLVREKPVADFVGFLAKNATDWAKETRSIIED